MIKKRYIWNSKHSVLYWILNCFCVLPDIPCKQLAYIPIIMHTDGFMLINVQNLYSVSGSLHLHGDSNAIAPVSARQP